MYMGIYLVDAVVDLDPPREQLNPLVRRFLGWLLSPALTFTRISRSAPC